MPEITFQVRTVKVPVPGDDYFLAEAIIGEEVFPIHTDPSHLNAHAALWFVSECVDNGLLKHISNQGVLRIEFPEKGVAS